MTKSILNVALLVALFAPRPVMAQRAGILLLAHGGSAEWNARVIDLTRTINQTQPAEVAFGMATRRTIQDAVDRLNARGVEEIVAVPLFVSSWSSVVTSSEFLLGLRTEAPKDLAVFARMDHSQPAAAPAGDVHPTHDRQPVDGSTPVVSKARITRMTAALNAHPLVAEILTSRARAISRAPEQESVIIVAHGPVSTAENQLWLADMKVLAAGVAASGHFASVEYLTVKDDAPKPIRDAATAELRTLVSRRIGQGRRVLIAPLLLSFGGIEKGIATRLKGLRYTMAEAALMPDERVARWVLEMAHVPAAR